MTGKAKIQLSQADESNVPSIADASIPAPIKREFPWAVSFAVPIAGAKYVVWLDTQALQQLYDVAEMNPALNKSNPQ